MGRRFRPRYELIAHMPTGATANRFNVTELQSSVFISIEWRRMQRLCMDHLATDDDVHYAVPLDVG